MHIKGLLNVNHNLNIITSAIFLIVPFFFLENGDGIGEYLIITLKILCVYFGIFFFIYIFASLFKVKGIFKINASISTNSNYLETPRYNIEEEWHGYDISKVIVGYVGAKKYFKYDFSIILFPFSPLVELVGVKGIEGTVIADIDKETDLLKVKVPSGDVELEKYDKYFKDYRFSDIEELYEFAIPFYKLMEKDMVKKKTLKYSLKKESFKNIY